jgi:hypothetical protein
MSTDPVFTQARRNEIAGWGLCADEFAAYGHFPPQLYVRASRRMRGIYVMKQSDVLDDIVKPDAIMVSSFPIDSHDCRRVAIPGGGVINEGTIFPVRQSTVRIGYPHHVPYRSILPQRTECDNLLVPVALSSTHVAISSLRIEATWMLIGQSAGIAAALAADQDVTVQDLPYEDLKTRMLAQGQVLTLPEGFQPLEGIVLDDPDAELAGTWTPSTSVTPFQGEGYRYAGAAGTPNDGSAVATFRFTAPEAGTYRFKIAYSPDPSRASNVPVTVTSGTHVSNFSVDQTVARPPESVMREIGTVQLVADQESLITIGTAGTTGFVILDAVQLVLETPAGSTGWSGGGASGITETASDISATLLGTEAVVTLYWKAGNEAPEQHTGWDGSISDPGTNVSPGLVARTITGLQSDTVYSCIFNATNTAIPSEAWSAPITFTTAFGPAQVPKVIGAVVGESSITLTWEDNASNETGYIIQRSTNLTGPFETIATLAANSTSYVDNTLQISGTYFYRLAASNSGNGSTTDFSASQISSSITISTPTIFQAGISPDAGYGHDATYIRSNDVTFNFNDTGQLIIGATAGGAPDVLRGFLEFDLRILPAGTSISRVMLELTTFSTAGINNVGSAGATSSFNLHAYALDLDETTATWSTPDAAASDVPGGSSGDLLCSASFDVEGTGQTIAFNDSPAFRAAVESALAGDGMLRLVLRGADETTGIHQFARFHDETAASLAQRPKLSVLPGSLVFKITAFQYSPSADEIAFTWDSISGKSYRVTWSLDLNDWTNTLASGIPADAGASTSKAFGLSPAGISGEASLFFRIEEEP